ncbi:MAG: thiamine pyrophosphate enzyme-like TPP-binding protein [Hyphomicrobiales bacterium]|jgi:thiamine pyrophosphate-dependent acetolactate synthase large subunit-like protein|nr:thiamine pyrophosphate enzyme-like TPP-binding protein [Hyphomicrobiales bacterium]
MIDRKEAWARLAAHITDEIVVATYSSATDWIATVDRPLNYFSVGAMGLASSHGLGLALARPERRVIVLDGDGSLLMNLGTLVTIGAVAPKNFTHIVARNETYEANGGHPTPGRAASFAGLAREAGIAKSYRIDTLDGFEALIPALLSEDGPIFVELIIAQGELSARSYKDMYRKERRTAFRQALQNG